MISILQHIQYLILHHDCVVVPGLGAFVARYVGASFTPDGTSLTAPGRELGFNALLSHDDGLLTGSVTRREGVSYECARSAVEREVELIHRRLRHEGSVSLDRIGILSLNGHGAIEFAPAAESAIHSLPFCGFTTLTLHPAAQHTEETQEPIILEVDTRKNRKNWLGQRAISALKYAASVAVAFGIGLTMLTPLSPDNVDKASLSAPIEKVVNLDDDNANEYANREIKLYVPDAEEATAVVPMKTAANGTVDLSQNYASAPKYYVIVASTTSLKEARRYVRHNSTAKYPLQILPADGRYRVFAASGDDFEKMSAFRNTDAAFAKANPNAWVYTLER